MTSWGLFTEAYSKIVSNINKIHGEKYKES